MLRKRIALDALHVRPYNALSHQFRQLRLIQAALAIHLIWFRRLGYAATH
jgi:hypothetical protein